MKTRLFPYQNAIAAVSTGVLAIFGGTWQTAQMQQTARSAQTTQTQRKPLTLAEVLTGLRSRKVTIAEKNQLLTEGVEERAVSFPLTAEIESELKSAGASDELIEAIRRKNPRANASKPPESPKPTPKPIPTATPMPTPKPDLTIPAGARSAGKLREYTEDLPGKAKLKMACLGGGTFVMGAPETEFDSYPDEKPQRLVAVKDFCIGKYEITQAQWKAVMGTTLRQQIDKVIASGVSGSLIRGEGDEHPIYSVTWKEAKEFVAKLSQLTGREYRLPTEAEWEFAARAGTTGATAFGSTIGATQANFDGREPYDPARGTPAGPYLEKTVPVGSYQPNAWGLYDMHGNIDEWAEDVYSENYNKAPADGSANTKGEDANNKVKRGGNWSDGGYRVRSAAREKGEADKYFDSAGLRVVSLGKKR